MLCAKFECVSYQCDFSPNLCTFFVFCCTFLAQNAVNVNHGYFVQPQYKQYMLPVSIMFVLVEDHF